MTSLQIAEQTALFLQTKSITQCKAQNITRAQVAKDSSAGSKFKIKQG